APTPLYSPAPMSAPPAQELASFAEVRAWLQAMSSPGSGLRMHADADGTVAIARSRATVTVVAPGHRPPERFDHLLVVGPHEDLAAALEGLADPRVHLLGLPCHPAVLARVVDAALEAADAFARARVTDQLLDIGLALNAERQPQRVLELILQHARSITNADAGTIYLVDEQADEIRFAVAENDSVQTNLGDHVLHIGDGSVVGNAVLQRRVIRSSHLYRRTILPGNFVRHDRSIDVA